VIRRSTVDGRSLESRERSVGADRTGQNAERRRIERGVVDLVVVIANKTLSFVGLCSG
jgi:hypothetical protein